MSHNRKTCPECQFETNMDEVSVIGENHAQTCLKYEWKLFPEQKEEWEEELYNLAAINYNLYLSGTCERADTGEDWTFDDARWEIRDFIRTQIVLAEERGRREGAMYGALSDEAMEMFNRHEEERKKQYTLATITEFIEWAKRFTTYENYEGIKHIELSDLLAFAYSLKSNLTQKS